MGRGAAERGGGLDGGAQCGIHRTIGGILAQILRFAVSPSALEKDAMCEEKVRRGKHFSSTLNKFLFTFII